MPSTTPESKEGKYPWMLQRGGGGDLGEKPVSAEDRSELRAQNLERNLSLVPEILGEIDGGHAPGTELTFDAVSARQDLFEARLHRARRDRNAVKVALQTPVH